MGAPRDTKGALTAGSPHPLTAATWPFSGSSPASPLSGLPSVSVRCGWRAARPGRRWVEVPEPQGPHSQALSGALCPERALVSDHEGAEPPSLTQWPHVQIGKWRLRGGEGCSGDSLHLTPCTRQVGKPFWASLRSEALEVTRCCRQSVVPDTSQGLHLGFLGLYLCAGHLLKFDFLIKRKMQ